LRLSPARTALFLATSTLLSALLCIHLLPNRVSLKLGDVADREIIAQRTVRYEDTEATRQLRDDAAQRVDIQYEPIPGALTNALDGVRTVFDMIDRAARAVNPVRAAAVSAKAVKSGGGAAPREDPNVWPRQVATDIRQQSNIFLARDDVGMLLRLSPAARDTARTATLRLVERTMGRSITDNTNELAQVRSDLNTDAARQGVPKPLRGPVVAVARAVLTPTRHYADKETERRRQAARTAVPTQLQRIAAGTAVIRSGERVTQRHLDMFKALGLQNASLDALTVAVIAAMVWLLVALTAVYLYQFHRDLYDDTPRLLLLSILSVVSVVGLKIGSTLLGLPITGVHVGYLGMMCVASAGMAIALLISPRVATLIVALLSVASGLVLNHELRFTVITLGSSLVGIVSVSSLRNRGDLLRAAVIVCASNAVLNVLVGQLEGDVPAELGYGALWGIVSGLFALALFWFGIAVFEKWFGITTHLRLLELSDPATPILQEFRMRVPGTYAHSLMVGNLAQAAAEAIGADALLVRVAAYYHDLGKMNRPEFFIENQSNAENVHDRLSPSLSAIILASHVKEGLEIAEEVGMPIRVRDVIQQHHGTTLMKYFYHRATGGMYDPTLEAQFRYPGPKPQTKEAAILMLADGVEAASRTLERPTPARIADFVERMVQDKLTDGQLDECDLTLRDLKAIQDVFTRTLSGTLHARIEYPGAVKRPAASAPTAAPPQADETPAVVTLATLKPEDGERPELTLVAAPAEPVQPGVEAATIEQPLSAFLAAPETSATHGTDAPNGTGSDSAALGARGRSGPHSPRPRR
jgi:hypothetical protein